MTQKRRTQREIARDFGEPLLVGIDWMHVALTLLVAFLGWLGAGFAAADGRWGYLALVVVGILIAAVRLGGKWEVQR